jgi:asparagine synthase (glutamine-hydrolysing)
MEWLRSQDQPSIDGLNSFTISKLARPFVTVALAGLGGDEFLAGYSTFKWARLLAALRRRWNRVPDLRSNASWDRGRMDTFWDLWSTASDPLTDYLGIKLVAPLSLVDTQAASGFVARAREARERLPRSYSSLAEVAALETAIYLQNMLLRDADNMSMRNSLEVRFPFLDYRLVEMLLGPQMEGFVSSRHGAKVPLRRYARRVGIKASNHKRGFAVPLGRWSRQPAVSEMLDAAFGSDSVGLHVYGRKRIYELREMARGSEFPTYRSLWQMWAVAVVNAHLRPAN